MLDKIDKIEMEDDESAIFFKFPPATHSGKKVIELKNISKSYGDKLVLHNLDFEMERGEKVGLVGVNGAGKSTLARIIRGTEEFQRGERKLGYQVELEYYSQHQADTMDPNNTVLGTMDSVATGDVRKSLRNILGSFLFKGDDAFKNVSVLSGGEKSRLALAKMLLKASNFLVLDEPTNHLDMNSKKVLMDSLRTYTGTILIISHDREFLDGIVTKIIEVKNKNVKTYFGNCSYYLMKKKEESEGITVDNKAYSPKQENSPNKPIIRKKSKDQKRLEAFARNKAYSATKPIKEKIEIIEKETQEYEQKLKRIEELIASPEVYENPDKVIKSNKELKQIKDKLNHLYHDWMVESKKLTEAEATIKA